MPGRIMIRDWWPLLAVLLLLGVSSTVHGQLLSEMPLDFEDKVIDGTHAMAVMPVVRSGGKIEGYLPPEGFEARLVNRNHPEEELVFPAGTWFLPPPGFYHVWAEGNWWISPSPSRLSYGGSTEMVVTPGMVPGGKVGLRPGSEEAGGELILWTASSGNGIPGIPFVMKRRRAVSEVGEGVMLPEGVALAALWSRDQERFLALSRPFEVRFEKIVQAPLETPESTAHLFVELGRNRDRPPGQPPQRIAPHLRQGGRERAPDFTLPTAFRTYAVWYDVEPGAAVVRADSPGSVLVPEEVVLEAGRVHHRRLEMMPRRILDVDVEVPSPLDREALELSVEAMPAGTALAEARLDPGSTEHRFDGLPPVVARVTLRTSVGSFAREVDLREQRTSYLTLAPELLSLWGRVELGDEGHEATISLRTVGGETVRAETDPQGFYEVAVLEPVRSVEVVLIESEAAPYADFFSPPIRENRELSFRLLDVENRVEVRDARTGEPIAGAQVTARNEYEEHDEALERAVEKAVVQRVETDAEGVALLPPLRSGWVEVEGKADGYLPVAEPVRREVTDPSEDLEVQLALEPVSESTEVRLRLPDGGPAAGAEVMLAGSAAGETVLFTGSADSEGTVRVPGGPAGSVLLARHAGAGGGVRGWPPRAGEGRVDWSLPKAAPSALSVEVRSPSGEQAVGQARLALWVDGYRLSGIGLAWLTRSRPHSGPNGFWVGQNLPPRPVSVVAWRRGLTGQALAGELDTLATEIPYPWPSPAVVHAVE